MSNIYYWEELTFSKLVRKVNSSERKFEEMHFLRRAKKYKVCLGKRLFWHDYLQLFFFHKIVSEMSFNLFCLGDKRLLSEFLGEWDWFQGHNERFPKYPGWKLKIEKTEERFCRWKNTDNNDINISLSLQNPCNFSLWKKIAENANTELSQNCTEKQIMPSKITINWLFNDILCYLFIACFDWKIRVFQQTVVRVYYTLNISKKLFMSC